MQGTFPLGMGPPAAGITATIGIDGSADVGLGRCMDGSSVTGNGAARATGVHCSRHGLNRAQVVRVVTGSGVSSMSERVDKRYLICCAERVYYFNVALDNCRPFALNNIGSLYMLISSVLAQELGLRINKHKKTFKVVDGEPKAFVGFLDE